MRKQQRTKAYYSQYRFYTAGKEKMERFKRTMNPIPTLSAHTHCRAAPLHFLDLLIILWTSALLSGVYGRGLNTGVCSKAASRGTGNFRLHVRTKGPLSMEFVSESFDLWFGVESGPSTFHATGAKEPLPCSGATTGCFMRGWGDQGGVGSLVGSPGFTHSVGFLQAWFQAVDSQCMALQCFWARRSSIRNWFRC